MDLLSLFSGGKLDALEADAKAFLANSEKIAAIIVGTGDNPLSILEAIAANFQALSAELADVKALIADVHALVASSATVSVQVAAPAPAAVTSTAMAAASLNAAVHAEQAQSVVPPGRVVVNVAAPAVAPSVASTGDPFTARPLAHSPFVAGGA